jgi:hypothetical protein
LLENGRWWISLRCNFKAASLFFHMYRRYLYFSLNDVIKANYFSVLCFKMCITNACILSLCILQSAFNIDFELSLLIRARSLFELSKPARRRGEKKSWETWNFWIFVFAKIQTFPHQLFFCYIHLISLTLRRWLINIIIFIRSFKIYISLIIYSTFFFSLFYLHSSMKLMTIQSAKNS